MNKNAKGFANIIIILIVVALAGAGIYFVSTQENGLFEPSLSNNSTSTSDTVPSLPSTQTTQSNQNSIQTPSQPSQIGTVLSVIDLTSNQELYVGKRVRVQGKIVVNVFQGAFSCPLSEPNCDTSMGAQLELWNNEKFSGAENLILLFKDNQPYPCEKISPATYKCGPYTSKNDESAILSGVWSKDKKPIQWVNATPVKWVDRYFLNIE